MTSPNDQHPQSNADAVTPQQPPATATPQATAPIAPAPGAASSTPHAPVKRIAPIARPSPRAPAKKPPKPDDRRDFFSDAMREALGPFTGIIERKLHPILAALEAIPAEAERLAEFDPKDIQIDLPPLLDQPQSRTLALPQADPPPAPQEFRFLRPPGAMAPGMFETVCSRCNLCVDACPAHAIKMDSSHILADGLPYILPAEQACVVCSDLACMKACPTGALKLVDRLKVNLGTATVDRYQCVRENGENCTRCVDACPITQANAAADGTAVPPLDAIFIHAETGRIRVRKNVCIGCGLCENRCPTNPTAITVLPFRLPVDPIIA